MTHFSTSCVKFTIIQHHRIPSVSFSSWTSRYQDGHTIKTADRSIPKRDVITAHLILEENSPRHLTKKPLFRPVATSKHHREIRSNRNVTKKGEKLGPISVSRDGHRLMTYMVSVQARLVRQRYNFKVINDVISQCGYGLRTVQLNGHLVSCNICFKRNDVSSYIVTLF